MMSIEIPLPEGILNSLPELGNEEQLFEGLRALRDEDLAGMGITFPQLDEPPPPRSATRPARASGSKRPWRNLGATLAVLLIASGAGAAAMRPGWRALSRSPWSLISASAPEEKLPPPPSHAGEPQAQAETDDDDDDVDEIRAFEAAEAIERSRAAQGGKRAPAIASPRKGGPRK